MILRLAPLALLLFTTACIGKADVDRFFAQIHDEFRNEFRGGTPRAAAAAVAERAQAVEAAMRDAGIVALERVRPTVDL